MRKHLIFFLFFFVSIASYSQGRFAEGFVLDKESHAALQDAEVWVEGEKQKANTNERGAFIVDVRKGRQYLLVRKPGYSDFRYKLQPGFQHKKSRIYLESIKAKQNDSKEKQKNDSLFFTYKNAVSLSILDFFQVGLGLRYERLLAQKHSLGLNATYYFYGVSSVIFFDIFGGYELRVNYKGFKAAPFYRFYLVRKKTKGVFLDAKIPFGYFNFDNLEYRYSYYYDSHRSKYIDHSFWTWGGGISIGFMARVGHRNHGFINISVGYQYLPMANPPEALYEEENGHTFKYETDVKWWNQTGPGSKFDVKLTLGGIF